MFEHIEELEGLFHEVERILIPEGRRIIGHFLQRREFIRKTTNCLLYTSPSPRDATLSRMPSSA